MSQSQEEDTSTRRNVSFLCDYLGISRQGYYKYIVQEKEEEILGTSIVLYATELRKDLPKAGMRELYELCRRKFQYKFSIGRDQCYNLFRSNGLCQRYRKRPRTTFSNHNYFIFDDLLNTTPKLKPTHFGQLCVADITYVATQQGWAYRYCPKKVCKLQSSYICVMNKKSTKNNEAYKRTKIGINF